MGKREIQQLAKEGPLHTKYNMPNPIGGNTNTGALAKKLMGDKCRADFVDLFFVRLPYTPSTAGDPSREAVTNIVFNFHVGYCSQDETWGMKDGWGGQVRSTTSGGR